MDVWATEYRLATAYVKTSRWAEAHETISPAEKLSSLMQLMACIRRTAMPAASKLGLWDEPETHLAYLESDAEGDVGDHRRSCAGDNVPRCGSPVKPSRVWRICAKLYEKAGVTAKAEWANSQ